MTRKNKVSLRAKPLSEILDALSDPVRLHIVRTLLQQEEACCSELNFNLAKSTMSHHFKVLFDAGIISRREEGNRQINCLRKKELDVRCPGLLDSVLASQKPL